VVRVGCAKNTALQIIRNNCIIRITTHNRIKTQKPKVRLANLIFIMALSDDGQEIVAFVYDKHFKRMLFIAQKILGKSKGEDAVNDSFVKLIERFENNPEDLRDKPGTYFVIVSRNHSLNIRAKDKKDAKHLNDDDDSVLMEIATDESLGIDSQLANKEGYGVLVDAIRRMKPNMREILEYKCILEYTNQEIAEAMGLSENVVSSRIDRAKKKLREILGESEEIHNGD